MHADNVNTARGGIAVRRVSWGAIFAGVVVAMALMIFFTVLGIALGASIVDPFQDNSASAFGGGAAIYTVVTQILSLCVGGYVAARLAGVPRVTASILHGGAVWALSTLLLAWAAIAGTSTMFNAASSVLTTTMQGAASAVQSIVPEDVSFPDFSDIARQISVEDLPDPVQSTLEENNITIEDLRREAQQAYSQVISSEEQEEAVDLMQSTLADALASPGTIGEELNQALDSLIVGPDAILSQEDREEALTVLQRRLGITQEETEQILQAIESRAEEAIAEVRQTADQLQQQAVEAADAAASAISTTAWWLTLASLLGLAAAMGGAFLGKPDGLLGDRLDDRYS